MSRSPTSSIWQYFGLNMGSDINFGGANYSTRVIDNDCDYLVNKVGINYYRMNADYSNSTGITQVRYLAQKLRSMGANVQYGVATGGSFNASKQSAFETVVLRESAWAQSVGIQRFQVGNEVEINTDGSLTEAQVYTYLQTIPAMITSVGFTGSITASVSQNHYNQWTSNGVGNYTDLGADIYGVDQSVYGIGSYKDFVSQNNTLVSALGANVFLSEWACHAGQGDLNLIDPELYAKNMMYRLQYIKGKYSRPCYLHCWRFNGTNTQDLWAAKKDSGETRLFWFDVTEQRRLTYY